MFLSSFFSFLFDSKNPHYHIKIKQKRKKKFKNIILGSIGEIGKISHNKKFLSLYTFTLIDQLLI